MKRISQGLDREKQELEKAGIFGKRQAEDTRGLILNEWANLTVTQSNRRLNVKGIDTPYKILWSIDRITIVGETKKYRWFRDDLQVFELDFEQIWQIFTLEGRAKPVGSGWVLLDEYGENVAYAEKVKYAPSKGRLDFNPQKIGRFLTEDLKHFIHRIFDNPHFSRADVACDILGLPNEFVSQYSVVDAVKFKPIYGRSGELETAYWGSRSSEKQVRLYNKKLEQTMKKKVVPKEIETWWRLEVQLRRAKASDWAGVMSETLGSFCSLNYLPVDMKGIDKVVLTGLQANHQMWSELSRPTKYKYRDMMLEIGKNDELTQDLKETFVEAMADLKEELDTWLVGLDVTDEDI